MRFMVMVKATKNSEAGMLPTQELLADMGRFNEELVKAGVMLAGEGLHITRRATGGRAVRAARRAAGSCTKDRSTPHCSSRSSDAREGKRTAQWTECRDDAGHARQR